MIANDNAPAARAPKIADCPDCSGTGSIFILGESVACPTCRNAEFVASELGRVIAAASAGGIK